MEVYRQRHDIKSVVHAHPPYCTSFAVAGIPLNKCVLPEAILTLGAVPIAPYGTPSTREIPDSVKPYVEQSDAILLANHGALTMGVDLLTAYHRMETLEHSATIVFLAIQLGNVNIIPEKEVEKLMEVREKMNIPGRINLGGQKQRQSAAPTEEDVEAITLKVMERLKEIKK
jgi:L-fuculose-phosphate aldolase